MVTFAEKIISFCLDLEFNGSLPEGISVMNPFRNNPDVITAVSEFYRKFYSDNNGRHLILGINPGRFGAGITGIPFTDTIRLFDKCGLTIPSLKSYETSSAFIYEMIDRYGGPFNFYRDYYISSVCPLGFTATGHKGREVNYNYYDSKMLADAITDFAVSSLQKQIGWGIDTDICYCLGTGKNYRFLSHLNDKHKFFLRIEPLEHPRYIMQYKLKEKDFYIADYIRKLRQDV
ncbi:MAG: uracil-DNA glycosylase family protein [Bacteroidales bacterium]|jgi:hypothetical protein